MTQLEISFNSSKYKIFINRDWKTVGELIGDRQAVILTDINIDNLYGDDFPDYPVITIGTGEAVKEIETVETIIKHLVTIGADRSTFLLAIGGGLVCDIGGFVASVFHRGIDFGFISTSLLSQVDASIGGKNGVNIYGIKNIIGCFNHPSFVICDQNMFSTLSDEEYISGLGEVLKHALVRDAQMFDFIEENILAINNRDIAVVSQLVERSIRIKSSVVEADGREKGLRRILNFGHTFGHAIEAGGGLKHGYAVAHGMLIASEISLSEKLITENELLRIRKLLSDLKLISSLRIEKELIEEFIRADKKREGAGIHFILLEGLGLTTERVWPVDKVMEYIPEKGLVYEGRDS